MQVIVIFEPNGQLSVHGPFTEPGSAGDYRQDYLGGKGIIHHVKKPLDARTHHDIVQSESDPDKTYTITWRNIAGVVSDFRCQCPDHMFRYHERDCKHIRQVKIDNGWKHLIRY